MKNKWSWEQLCQEGDGSDGENGDKSNHTAAQVRKKKAAQLKKELREAKMKAVEVDKWREG